MYHLLIGDNSGYINQRNGLFAKPLQLPTLLRKDKEEFSLCEVYLQVLNMLENRP